MWVSEWVRVCVLVCVVATAMAIFRCFVYNLQVGAEMELKWNNNVTFLMIYISTNWTWLVFQKWRRLCEKDASYKWTLQHTAPHCNTLQHISQRCRRVLGGVASYKCVMQPAATHCNALQHTLQPPATHLRELLLTNESCRALPVRLLY